MKIVRYHMEDWLNDSFSVEFNLSSSGCRDFRLGEFLSLCDTDLHAFEGLFLGDNDTRGSLELREAICESYSAVETGKVMVSNGSSESLFCFFNELLEKGDEVVIHFPAFQCLYQIPMSIGCNVKFLNLFDMKNWRLDIEKLDALVSEKTRLIIVNNPQNPLGWTLTADEIRSVGEIASKNGTYLLFDEHYRYLPLTAGTDLIPSGYDLCVGNHPLTYATGSMIKCFGIVGIRIGWLLGEPKMLSRARDYKDYLTHTIPALTDFIALTALKNSKKIIELKKADILANLSSLNEFMAANEDFFHYVEPTGGVVCFPALRNTDDSAPFCRILLKDYGVSLLPGFSFEADSHFRLNFGTDHASFMGALERISDCVDKIRKGKYTLKSSGRAVGRP